MNTQKAIDFINNSRATNSAVYDPNDETLIIIDTEYGGHARLTNKQQALKWIEMMEEDGVTITKITVTRKQKFEFPKEGGTE